MTREPLVCWSCGRGLDDVPQPLSRYGECPGCRAELYVCRMCRFYDTTVAQSCQEPMADEVKDKTRANFCDFLQPRPDAFAPEGSAGDGDPRTALAVLFGDAPADEGVPADDEARGPLDSLFGDDPAGKG